MKENLPKEQCGMLKNSIFALFSFFFSPLCFLNNAYWMLFPVLAAFVVDCFLFFFFVSKGSCTQKIVKDSLSPSQSVDLSYRSPLLFWNVKGMKGWLCLYFSTPTQPPSPFKALSNHRLLIRQTSAWIIFSSLVFNYFILLTLMIIILSCFFLFYWHSIWDILKKNKCVSASVQCL